MATQETTTHDDNGRDTATQETTAGRTTHTAPDGMSPSEERRAIVRGMTTLLMVIVEQHAELTRRGAFTPEESERHVSRTARRAFEEYVIQDGYFVEETLASLAAAGRLWKDIAAHMQEMADVSFYGDDVCREEFIAQIGSPDVK